MIIIVTAISKKRIMDRAWMYFIGNGASCMPTFSESLRAAWKIEKDLVKSKGVIYTPYIPLTLK